VRFRHCGQLIYRCPFGACAARGFRTGAGFFGANLSGALLLDANLTGADLTHANLTAYSGRRMPQFQMGWQRNTALDPPDAGWRQAGRYARLLFHGLPYLTPKHAARQRLARSGAGSNRDLLISAGLSSPSVSIARHLIRPNDALPPLPVRD
jgi:hypothetical protein